MNIAPFIEWLQAFTTTQILLAIGIFSIVAGAIDIICRLRIIIELLEDISTQLDK